MSNTEAMKGANVLMVDDAPANLDLLRNILEPSGCRIYFATSGEMALEVAPSCTPDIILMDVMMPGIDGFETCRRLKAMEELAETPVMFVTARTDVTDLAQGFSVGGVDYITKPVKPLEVNARVSAHLKIKRLVEQQKNHLAALEAAKKELQELNATKDRFLSSIGHDLRESLAGITRTTVVLKEAAGDVAQGPEQMSAELDGLNRSAEQVLRLLENILEWPRVQAGQKLDLFNTVLTDRNLDYLVAGLDNLRFLSLAETGITDAGLAHLSRLTDLEELHLDNTSITDQGLDALAALPSLRVLDLKDTAVTDAGLARVKDFATLRGLYLTRTRITDAGLANIGSLENLETLILWGTGVTDAGLEHLRSLTRLRELILWDTRVTEEGAEALRAALPGCDISLNMLA